MPKYRGTPTNDTQGASASKVVRLVHALDAQIAVDTPTSIMEVKSEKGFRGFRVAGSTAGQTWTVDLFGGNCYIVRVDGFETERVTDLIRVILSLRVKLGPRSIRERQEQ